MHLYDTIIKTRYNKQSYFYLPNRDGGRFENLEGRVSSNVGEFVPAPIVKLTDLPKLIVGVAGEDGGAVPNQPLGSAILAQYSSSN